MTAEAPSERNTPARSIKAAHSTGKEKESERVKREGDRRHAIDVTADASRPLRALLLDTRGEDPERGRASFPSRSSPFAASTEIPRSPTESRAVRSATVAPDPAVPLPGGRREERSRRQSSIGDRAHSSPVLCAYLCFQSLCLFSKNMSTE